MALQGKLKIAGRTYGVVECSYKFSQSIDDTGKPTSRPRGGTITMVMPSTSDDDLFFYKWMFNKTEVNGGILRFVVFSNHNKRSYKSVEFANAYCIELQDYFNHRDHQCPDYTHRHCGQRHIHQRLEQLTRHLATTTPIAYHHVHIHQATNGHH